MLPKVMEEALNVQIKAELESAYTYLSMSAYCEVHDQFGFARWLRLQAQEELKHAIRFFDFINERGGRATLEAIEKPPSEFGTLVELFEKVLSHEVKISSLIHRLYEQATAEKDYASLPFLQEFIVEQIEEEKSAADMLALVKRAGNDMAAVMTLDRQVAQRTNTD